VDLVTDVNSYLRRAGRTAVRGRQLPTSAGAFYTLPVYDGVARPAVG
jgi:hypothetical protein